MKVVRGGRADCGVPMPVQEVAKQRALQEATLDSLLPQVKQMRATLSNLKGQVTKARDDRDKVLRETEVARQNLETQKWLFEESLKQQQIEFDAELKEKARVVEVNLQENIFGLKRELEGLKKEIALATTERDRVLEQDLFGIRREVQAAQDELKSLTAQVTEKNIELSSAQSRLNTANAALDALKARL